MSIRVKRKKELFEKKTFLQCNHVAHQFREVKYVQHTAHEEGQMRDHITSSKFD